MAGSSTIEQLPAEILQEIFKHSSDFNLPQCSPYIAAKLSSPAMYIAACDYAFTSDHQRTTSATLQKQLFSRRWMTWAFFRRYLLRDVDPGSCPCWLVLLGYDEGRNPCHLPIKPTDISCGADRSRKLSWIKNINCPLPTKLTHGPFTPDKVQFLRLLLRATNMSIDRANKEAIRVAARGRVEAIRDHNHDIAYLFSHTRRLGSAISLNLIKFAIIECDCDRSIVFDLMISAKESRLSRWNDVELDEWIARQESIGNPKGKWLKKKLEELRGGRWPDAESADYSRSDTLRIPSATFEFPL